MKTPKTVTTSPQKKIGPPPSFELVKNPLPEDAFHRQLPRRRRSYYVDALAALASSKRGTVLCFESSKAEAGLSKAAKKLGYTIHFALHEEKLYVQLVDTGDDK